MTPPTKIALSLPLEPSVRNQQVEEDVSVGPSIVVHPSAGKSQEPPVQSSEWRMFLRRRDREMALSRRLLQGLKEFKRYQRRSLENDVFKISLDHALLSTSQVALPIDLFIGRSVRCPALGLAASRLEGKGLDHRRPPEEA